MEPTAGPIELQLCHASLNDNDTHYDAISYVWGSLDERTAAEIYVNGSSFTIGRNLHAGLTQLRKNGVQSWLWVDSICIQQSDLSEKTWQVGQMHSIVNRADLVHIWLGSGCDETDTAMDFATRVGPRALAVGASHLWFDWRQTDWCFVEMIRNFIRAKLDSPRSGPVREANGDRGPAILEFIFDLLCEPSLRENSPLEDKGLQEGINILMQCEYWCRIWVIQEVSLAKTAVVLCGAKSVSLEALDAVLCAIELCKHSSYSTEFPDTAEFGEDIKVYRSLALTTRRRHRRGVPIRLADILYQSANPPKRAHYLATDPRDVVFGVLAVITDKEVLGLGADYSLTTANVFEDVTRALIKDGEGKHSARYSLDKCVPETPGENSSFSSLPSWVPDWRQIGKRGSGVSPIYGRLDIDATAGMPISRSDMGRAKVQGVLNMSGCRVDVIEQVMQATPQADDPHVWLSSILDFAHARTESAPGEDYVWHTALRGRYEEIYPETGGGPSVAWLIRDILRGQGDIDAELLTPEQVKFILEWLGDSQSELKTLAEKLDYLRRKIPSAVVSHQRGRAPFKTTKGMLGLGHSPILAGDVVTLLWGVKVPIILRPRPGGKAGFTYLGDAYVDGIMRGGFLETFPAHEDFEIY